MNEGFSLINRSLKAMRNYLKPSHVSIPSCLNLPFNTFQINIESEIT